MNQTIAMGHAPASRASRALRTDNVREMCARALSLARRKSVTIAAISAAVSFTGAILGHDALSCVAAFVALGFVYIANNGKKGGEA